MTFPKFQAMASQAGLVASSLNGGSHWQVRGGKFLVNYYPSRGTCFVNGMARGFKCRASDVIKFATDGPPSIGKKAARRGSYKAERARLFRKSRRCHWCDSPLTIATSTLDHRIALGMGGADTRDNYVLACLPCNKSRGCSALPPQRKDGVE